MKIVVCNKVIETKDIVSIFEIEEYKKRFLNREAGFVITFVDNTTETFGEHISYETTPREIGEIKSKWNNLRKKVIEQWQQDRIEFLPFNL